MGPFVLCLLLTSAAAELGRLGGYPCRGQECHFQQPWAKPGFGPANDSHAHVAEFINHQRFLIDGKLSREPLDKSWGMESDAVLKDGLAHLLTHRDRARRSYIATTLDGKPRSLATMNSVLRVVAPEGFVATVDCPDGAAISKLLFAAYGLPYVDDKKKLVVGLRDALVKSTFCKCAKNRFGVIPPSCAKSAEVCTTTSIIQTFDAYYANSFDVVARACVGKERCDIEVESGVFDGGKTLPWDMDGADPDHPTWPKPWKWLAIEAQCQQYCSPLAPAAPNAVVQTFVNPYNRSSGATAKYSCAAGFTYFSGATTAECKFGVSDFPTPTIKCEKCGMGFYCPGDGKRYSCPDGTYSNSESDDTSKCSGYCAPGYLCPQPGAVNAYTQPCGGNGDYVCPRGGDGTYWGQFTYLSPYYWWWWRASYHNNVPTIRVKVPENAYSLPLDLPVDRRWYWSNCPVDRKCVNGLMLPAFRFKQYYSSCWSGDSVSGISYTTLQEEKTGIMGSLRLTIDTPGFNVSTKVKWRVLDNVWQPSSRWFNRNYQFDYRGQRRWQRCQTSSLEMVDLGLNGRYAALQVKAGANPLMWDECGRRFPVVVRAEQDGATEVGTECLLHVTVQRQLRKPIITNCDALNNTRKVEEALPPGANVGAPLFATQEGGMQSGVVMRWLAAQQFVYTPGPIDFAVDTCSGQVFTSDILNRTVTGSNSHDIRKLKVRVIADGAALGMGSLYSECDVTINVTRRNNAPSVYTTYFTLAELRPANTLVGNLEFGDPDYDDAGQVTVTLASGDSRDPGAFVINPLTGAVKSTYELNALSSGIYKYYLKVNVSDGKAWNLAPLTIVVTPVPRPPFVPDQEVSLLEFRDDGELSYALSALTYRHPLNDNVTWTVSSNTTFTIGFSTGILQAAPGAKLDVYVQKVHTLTATAQDSQGNLASGKVTVYIVECNRAPVLFDWPNFNASVKEYSAAGSATGLIIAHGDSNSGDLLTLSLTGAQPLEALTLFSLDARSGLLRLAHTLPPPSTRTEFIYNETWAWPKPFTAHLDFVLTDNGVPSKSQSGRIVVNITEVRPRVRASYYTAKLNEAEGTSLGLLPLWKPAAVTGMGPIVWSLEGDDVRALNALGVHNETGELVLFNVSALNYNAQREYTVIAKATYTLPVDGATVPKSVRLAVAGSASDDDMKIASNLSLTSVTVTSEGLVTLNLTHSNRKPQWSTTSLRMYTPYRLGGRVGSALSAFVQDLDTPVQDLKEMLTFAIVSGNTADSAFEINATSGQLSVERPMSPALTFTQGSSGPITAMRIRVTDAGLGGGAGLYAEVQVIVQVTEGNLPPVINATDCTVPENVAPGYPVGAAISASDADPGTRLQYSIIWATEDGTFRIDQRSGQIFVNRSGLDFESRSKYVVVVQVVDSGSTPLTASAEVTIRLNDVNEPPAFTPSGTGPFFIPENSEPLTSVGKLFATDVDTGDDSGLRYTITNSNVGLNVESTLLDAAFSYFGAFYILIGLNYEQVKAPFAIDALTGELSVSGSALNMEARATYNMTVRVTDRRGLYDEHTVTVALTNVNDVPELDDQSIYVTENGYGSLTHLTAIDEDAGQKHVYSLGPHAESHYCTAWMHSKTTDIRSWLSTPGTQYFESYTAPAPIDLQRASSVGAPVTIDFRMGGPGKGKIVLSGSQWQRAGMQSWEDRYEAILDGADGSASLWRYSARPVSVSYTSWNTSDTVTYTSYSSTAVKLGTVTNAKWLAANPTGALGNYYLKLSGNGYRTLTFGARSSNGAAAVLTELLTVTDSEEVLAGVTAAALYVTMDATTSNKRITSVCWKETPFKGIDWHFYIDFATGEVIHSDLDYEQHRHYGIEVMATDLPVGTAVSPAYQKATAVLIVNVADVNEAPMWNATAMVSCANSTIARVLACITIPEHAPAGTVIATIPAAIDPDLFFMSGSLDYTFRTDSVPINARALDFANSTAYRTEYSHASNNYFKVLEVGYKHSSRDIIVANPALLDFESTNGAPVEWRVWVTDFGWSNRLSSSPALVVVRLTDVNEPPVLKPAVGAWSVEEMALPGTLVGTPYDWGVSDPDSAGTRFSTLTFAIMSGSGVGVFEIDASSGQISTANHSEVNYETSKNYTLTVVVSDGGGLSASASIIITVIDVNEAPTLSLPALVNVSETATDLFGPVLNVTDPDTGSFHTWMVVGGTGAAHFSMGCNGRLAVLPDVQLDAEVGETLFTIVVRVIDNGAMAMTDEKSMLIQVTDSNEAPSIAPNQVFTVKEGAPAGFVLGNVTWSDPDALSVNKAWATPTFSLASEGNLMGYLSIDPVTGTLKIGSRALLGVVDPVDDLDVKLEVSVDVTDGGGLRARATVVINVLGINYAPKWADLPGSVVLSVDERTPSSPVLAGDNVGTPVSATDRNAKHVSRLKFTVGRVWPSSGNYFFTVQSAIDGMGQAQVMLTAEGAAGVDHEKVRTYTLELFVADPEGASAATNVTVSIRDRNEAPSFYYPVEMNVTVAENRKDQSFFGPAARVFDPESDNVTFSIVGGNYKDAFEIDPASGRLRIASGADIDFESFPLYELTIKGSDSGMPDGNALPALSQVLRVYVLDVNEVPYWDTAAELPVLTIAENAGAAAAVGMVNSFAHDVDANDVVTFSIDESAWALDNVGVTLNSKLHVRSDGAIISDGLDFEEKPEYRVTVIAKDYRGLSSSAVFTVRVLNVNEAPSWSAAAWTKVFVRLQDGQVIGRPLSAFATDPDLASASNAEKLSFSIDSVTAAKKPTTGPLEPIAGRDLSPLVSLDPVTGRMSLGSVAGMPVLSGTGAAVSVTVTVRVTDSSGAYAVQDFDFVTTDNNSPPSCMAQSFSIAENTLLDAVVGTVVATDPDFVAGQVPLAFSLLAPALAGEVVPFTITSNGQLKVSSTRALDFETLKAASIAAGTGSIPTFVLTIAVTDGNVNIPLWTTCTASVTVIDVNEAPRLRPAGVAPATFAFALPENSASGTVLQILARGTFSFPTVLAAAAGSASTDPAAPGRAMHLQAADEDEGDLVLSFSIRTTTPADVAMADLFSVHTSTGMLTVKSNASPAALAMLDFETNKELALTIVVTDVRGLTDSASVRVVLIDMNDDSTWPVVGALKDSSGLSVTSLTVLESVRPGTLLGSVLALDVDAGVSGELSYALLPGREATPFLLNAQTGQLFLSNTSALDWEDKAVWNPTVIVTDSSSSPNNVSRTITLNVQDVPDAAILRAVFTVGTDGTNVVGSAYAMTHFGMSVLVKTDGGSKITFTGANLGLTALRLAAETLQPSVTTVSATYGPTTGLEYTSPSCRIVVSGSAVECTTAPSAGSSMLWKFKVAHDLIGGLTSNASSAMVRTGTLPPIITAVEVVADSTGLGLAAGQVLATLGTSYLRVKGSNFGPVGTSITLRYGPVSGSEYTGRYCTVKTAHIMIVCMGAAGVGSNLKFSVQATTSSIQRSKIFVSNVAYAAPIINSLNATLLSTAGGDQIMLVGANFGPRGTKPVTMAYARPSVWALGPSVLAVDSAVAELMYTASSCTVQSDSVITCTSSVGVGAGLVPRVTIAAQTSTSAVDTIAYRKPVITGIAAVGIDRLPTIGDVVIRITGTDFGPVTTSSPGKEANLTAHLGPTVTLLPEVKYGHMYTIPTAHVKPLVAVPEPYTACDVEGSRCDKQCGNRRFECVGEWLLDTAPQGSVCFETEDAEGVVRADFINATDGRCERTSGLRYTAASCRVTLAHTGMECKATPGSGKWLYIHLTSLGGQASPDVFRGAVLSYAPPVITEFSGDGSRLASTAGAQIVTIRGINFGPVQSDIRAVSYGFDSREFPGLDCMLVTPHEVLECTTSPGAGARLAWTITVSNQDSVTPLTDYAPPTVESVGGEGAADAATAGGQAVVIRGRNFASSKYLDYVTYGPTGGEFTAANCSVTTRDTSLTCYTVPGTGRRLVWRVSVRGQVSRLSTVFTSYAAPTAYELSVTEGATSGEEQVMLFGRDLGARVPLSSITVLFDRYGNSPKSLADISDEWAVWTKALMAGDQAGADEVQSESVAAWLESASVLPLIGVYLLNNNAEALLFDIPDGCGENRELVVLVDGVPSSTILTFSYLPSVILNVAPVRDAYGNMRVIVEGENFCGKPSIIIVQTERPAFTDISGVLPTLNVSAAAGEAPTNTTVQAALAEVQKILDNGRIEEAQSDELSDLQSQIGEQYTSLGARRLQAAGSSGSGGSGTSIIVNGRAVDPTVTTTKRVETVIPTPADLGKVDTTIAVAGAAGITPTVAFKDPSPSFDGAAAYRQVTGARNLQTIPIASAVWRTTGGEKLCIPDVRSLNTRDKSKVHLTVGGRECTDVALTVTADSVTVSEIVSTVCAMTPEGVGKLLAVVIRSDASTGGSSPAYEGKVFTYEAPQVTTVLDETSTPVKSVLSTSSDGVSTAGSDIVIKGSGFGSSDMSSPTVSYKAKVTLTLNSGAVVSRVDAPVKSQTDSKIVVAFPSGYGGHVSVEVQTRREPADDMLGNFVQSTLAVSRYASPTVTSAIASDPSTVGGSQLTIVGTNFGPSDIEPLVTVSNQTCALVRVSGVSHTYTQIKCILPPGQGGAAPVLVKVADQTSAPGSFTYSRPTVTGLTPLSGPTDGLAVDGTPLVLTMAGTNFGVDPVVEITPANYGSAAAAGIPVVRVLASAMTSKSHTQLVFPMPAGSGADMTVSVKAGDQSSTQTTFVFHYEAPRVSLVVRSSRTVDGCAKRTELVPRARDGQFINRTSIGQCYPTVGGFTLKLTGSSFGPSSMPLTVRVGGIARKVVSHTHTEAVVSMEAGMGDSLPVSASVAGQVSPTTKAGGAPTFAFDDPVITAIMPNIPFAVGGETLLISGYNFGNGAAPVNITVGGRSCENARWVNDSQVTCKSPSGLVGAKSLSISVAGRSTPFTYSEAEEVVMFMCKKGWYGMVGEECLDCAVDEPGASCPGGELNEDLVESLPGYFRINVLPTDRDRDRLCHPKRKSSRTLCPAFLPCEPAAACLGGNQCKVGFTGLRCAQCDDGFYRINKSCRACPDRKSTFIIIYVVAAACMMATAYVAARAGKVWTMAAIVIDYAQVLSLFQSFGVNWPDAVDKWLMVASASFFNLELIAPECSIGDVDFSRKWLAIEVFPFAVAAILVVAYSVRRIAKWFWYPEATTAGDYHPYLASGITVYRFMYIYLARNTLAVFDCAPLSSGDTKQEYLQANLDIPCYSTAGPHWPLVGAAIAGVIVYLVVLPALVAYKLYHNRGRVMVEQLALARGEPLPVTDAALAGETSGRAGEVEFRRVYHSLYGSFKPACWYWEAIIAVRKFGIVFTTLLFSRTTSFQQALCLLALVTTASLHVRCRPYFTADVAAGLLAKYDSRVQLKAAEDARAIAKAEKAARAKSGEFAAGEDEETSAKELGVAMRQMAERRQVYSLAAVRTRSVLLQRRLMTGFPVLSVVLDANTVEGILLTSLILQCLAGVMFGSSLFQGANLQRFFAMQYEGLATACILLLSFTATYILVVLAADVLLHADPDRMETICQSLLWWNASHGAELSDKTTLFGDSFEASKTRPWSMTVDTALVGEHTKPVGTPVTLNPMIAAAGQRGNTSGLAAEHPPSNTPIGRGANMRGMLRAEHATQSTRQVGFAPTTILRK